MMPTWRVGQGYCVAVFAARAAAQYDRRPTTSGRGGAYPGGLMIGYIEDSPLGRLGSPSGIADWGQP
jgi:hypothetical protein